MDTVTINGVEVFATGTHNGDVYGEDDLRGMIAAAPEVGFDAPLKLGHMSDGDTDRLLKAEGMPAFGYVRNLRLAGQKLLADFVNVPKRLAELIKTGAYKRVSSEIYWNYANGQRTWPRVLKAVALLGGEIPAVTNLREIEALYSRKDRQDHEYKTYYGDIEAATPSSLQFKAKATVTYRAADEDLAACATCRFYLGGVEERNVGACGLVEGEIGADAVCDLYEPREAYAFTLVPLDPARTYTADDGWQEFRITREQMRTLCPDCAERMEYRNLAELKYYWNEMTREYAMHAGLGARVGAPEGFRARCLASNLGEGATDPEAFCTKLTEFCFSATKAHANAGGEVHVYKVVKRGDEWCVTTEDGSKTLGCHPSAEKAGAQLRAVEASKHAAHSHEGTTRPSMGNEDSDMNPEEIKKLQDALAASQARVVELETKLKDADTLQAKVAQMSAQIATLETERATREDEALLDGLIGEGRMLPVERDTQKALLFASRVQVHKYTENGAAKERPMRDVLIDALKARPKLLQFSDVARGSNNQPPVSDDPVSEVQTRITKYRSEHPEVAYEAAYDAVLAADPQLKLRYAQSVTE